MGVSSVTEILDFAIGKEEEAAKMYTELAERFGDKGLKNIFLDFAREEQGHKNRLQAVKNGKVLLSAEQKILDLKIGDYLVDIGITEKITDYQQALVLAMKAEKAAYKLYTMLAAATDDLKMKETLIGLAQEEAKHKLRFEIEYDDNIYQEN